MSVSVRVQDIFSSIVLIIISCGILSKHFEISPFITHDICPPLICILSSALVNDFPGLKPKEDLLKYGSKIALSITCRAFCTIFSLGFPIKRGLVSPGLLVLGISLSLAGVNLNLPSFISLEVLSNHSLFILSSVSVVAPRVMFPGLLFIKE